ncbi:uncharacterized protein BKA78DRAFT_361143 [Phyllosticta capitalensis]|uniref:uncharacterized protein n=1 Tax=Phyllosticta capitalensis TaxID=121624 RepID=UPI003130EE47
MLGKTQARLQEHFCPLGSTPAVDLLRDFPKRHGNESQKVEVLSLEWGDPRDILLSLHLEGLDSQTKFNFTCSDQEPAILARNVFILTLIADGFDACGSKDNIVALAWRLFFHLAIPQEDLSLVVRKAEKLAEYSESLQSWASCPYGKWIRFYDNATLHSVHSLFLDYAGKSIEMFDPRGSIAVRAMHKMRAGGHIVQSILATGIHAERSLTTMSVALEGFWRTGVVAGNQRDEDEIDKYALKGGLANPLFGFSSPKFSERFVPWGMDPLTGFHLASAFDEIDHYTPSAVEKVVDAARAQFRQWSETFAAFVKTRRVDFRLYCGDPVRFCYTLQAGNPLVPAPPEFSYAYKNAWSSAPTQQLPKWEDETIFFDVIDAANVADQAGMLILLPAVVPLLRHEPSSILYTESLIRPHKEATTFNMNSSLKKLLCTAPEFLSMILGIAPSQYLASISADSFVPETTIWDVNELFQYRLRIPWRIIADSERYLFPKDGKTCAPVFDMDEVPEYLGKLYESMFKHETRGDGLTGMVSIIEEAEIRVPGDQRYYTRSSFALLLHYVKSYVDVDWNRVLSLLLEKIEGMDSTSFSEHRLQELQLSFHTVGLFDTELLKVEPRRLGEAPYDMYAPNDKHEGLLGQPDVPSTVYLAMVVPRSSLVFFTEDDKAKTVAMPLHMEVLHSLGDRNEFHSVQCSFGKLSKTKQDGIGSIEEDKAGWRGSSDLIVVCQVPLFALLHGPREGVTVSLDFDLIPPMDHFIQKMRGKSTIFKTGLADRARLHVLKEPPTTAGNLDSVRSLAVPRTPAVASDKREQALFLLDGPTASKHVEVKQFLPSESPVAQEIAKNPTTTTEVSVDTSLSVSVFVGNCDPVFVHLPYPIFPGPTEARAFREVSRSGIMLSAHTMYPGVGGVPVKGCFPVYRDASGNLFPWTLPRVALHAAPKIAISPNNSERVKSFAQRCMSHEEGVETMSRTIGPRVPNLPCPSPTTLLKVSLTRLATAIAEPGKVNPTIHFVRTIPGSKPHMAFVFVGLRHDMATSGLFIDGYVLPLTRDPIVTAMKQFDHVNAGDVGVIGPAHDCILHQYFICCAERCRTWEHRDECEYGLFPFGEPGTPAAKQLHPYLCHCGEGRMLKDFPKTSQYWVAKKYATRVAMPLLFGVPYVEEIDTRGTILWAELERMEEEEKRVKEGKCVHCGTKRESLKKCGKCKHARYCDSACQKAHWKLHKKICREKEDQ